VVAVPHESVRLGHGLRGVAADATDANQCGAAIAISPVHLFASHGQHGIEQADAGIANRELCRVDPDREPPGSGRRVVSGQRTLTSFVEPAVGVECERVCRNDEPSPQCLSQFCRRHGHPVV
jgi:hypothetical protein